MNHEEVLESEDWATQMTTAFEGQRKAWDYVPVLVIYSIYHRVKPLKHIYVAESAILF